MKLHQFTFIALSIVLIVACAGTQEDNAPSDPDGQLITSGNLNDIAGLEWILTKMIIEDKEVPLVKDSETTFKCDQEGGVTGKATLNRYSGNFKLQENGQISWSKALMMTRMAGPPELMEQESNFSQALMKTVKMYHQESKLVMISPDRFIVLEFEPSK
jgi:heat shock protein HslJ